MELIFACYLKYNNSSAESIASNQIIIERRMKAFLWKVITTAPISPAITQKSFQFIYIA